MKSFINVYLQGEEVFIFLDICSGSDIECPAEHNSNNESSFNYSKAMHIRQEEWYDTDISIDQFKTKIIEDISKDPDFSDLHGEIALELLACSGNNKTIEEFIHELDLNNEFNPYTDAHQPYCKI